MKFINVALVFIVIFCLCSCANNSLIIDKEDSFFSDFKIEGENVYIQCMVVVENKSNKEKNISLIGIFDNDVANHLLKNAHLNGYSFNGYEEIFILQPGKNYLDVVFIGEHAGGIQKHDRLLPEICITTL